MGIMLTAQFVNGVILPVLLVFMAIIATDKHVMKEHTIGPDRARAACRNDRGRGHSLDCLPCPADSWLGLIGAQSNREGFCWGKNLFEIFWGSLEKALL